VYKLIKRRRSKKNEKRKKYYYNCEKNTDKKKDKLRIRKLKKKGKRKDFF